MANEKPARFVATAWWNSDAFGGFSSSGFFVAGRGGATGGSIDKGALRFTSIDIGQSESINEAQLYIKCSGGASSGSNIKLKVWGVKEANPDSGDPFGRSKTTATNTIDAVYPGNGNYLAISVTSIVQEIVNQGGYARNNAIEFLIEDNGGTSLAYVSASTYLGTDETYLFYRIVAEPNFLPTPVTVSAPSFPAVTNYGLRVSAPGIDVTTATEDQLYFTSRKKVLKSFMEGSVACTAGVDQVITHNLGYKPFSLAYARANSKSFKLPRLFLSVTDPVGSDLEAWIEVTDTTLVIHCYSDADVYYYIFLDEQA